MLKALFAKSRNSLKLGVDGLAKIFTGLIVIKIITNIGDNALLANFSQLKMISALLISVTSSAFVIGLNKLELKYGEKSAIGGINSLLLVISSIIIFAVFVLESQIAELIGRSTEFFPLVILFLLASGYLANYFIGLNIVSGNNSKLANAKLAATFSSFIIFLVIYLVGVDVWASLFIYLISYYAFIACYLFNVREFRILVKTFSTNFEVVKSASSILIITLISALVFPACIVFLRFSISVEKGWDYVSFWEAEWQLSSLLLLIVSPVLSIVVTTFITKKIKLGELNKDALLKVILTFAVLALLFSITVFLMRDLLISILFNSDMLLRESSMLVLLFVNSLRLISVALFYILYVTSDIRNLIYGETLFGLTFFVAIFTLGILGMDLNLSLVVAVVCCFLFYSLKIAKTHEFKKV